MKNLLSNLKKGALWLIRQVAALFTDGEWDLDPYKLGAWLAYALAGWIAYKCAAGAQVLDSTKLGILAGLSGGMGTLGTTLMSQARKNDATLAGKSP